MLSDADITSVERSATACVDAAVAAAEAAPWEPVEDLLTYVTSDAP
jgi:TPP-dependent pyruvate/acetoin dehydrogenase alpha subunit